MKKIITTLALIVGVSTLQAQATDFDEKLLVKYTPKELSILKKEQPKQYEFEQYCTKNAFYIAASSKEKIAANPQDFGEIIIKDIDNINFHELKITLKKTSYQAFVVKGTDRLLMVKSINAIQQELNKK